MLNNNKMMLEALNDYVYGHEEAKKVLIALVNRSVVRCNQKWYKYMEDENLINTLKVLLIAPSGTGKTHLVESLKNVVHFPLIRLDATQLIPSGGGNGYKPDTVKKLILEECKSCSDLYPDIYPNEYIAVDRAVVFIDEIDKLGLSWESSGNWNKHVQSNFLTLIDNKNEFAGLSFIFAGTFDGITNTTKKRSIGFNNNNNIDKTPIDDKIIKFGLIPELVGRINYTVEMDVFGYKDFCYILENIILPKKYRDLAVYKIKHKKITETKIKEIALQAKESTQGVRFMQRAIDKLFLEYEFNADISGV